MNRNQSYAVIVSFVLATMPTAALAQDMWGPPPEMTPASPPSVEPSAQPAPALAPAPPPQATAPEYEQYVDSSAGPVVAEQEEVEDSGPRRFLHGFRLGYNFTFNYDSCGDNCQSPADSYGLRSPHSFVIGYEVAYRMIGNSWLNVLMVANVSITGLEQSLFLPSANLLVGFELNESFQIGVGMNLAPDENKVAHMIAAAGWTPRVGTFYTPVHVYLIPDVDGNHRAGATVGVTW